MHLGRCSLSELESGAGTLQIHPLDDIEAEALGHTHSLAALSEPVTVLQRPHLSLDMCNAI